MIDENREALAAWFGVPPYKFLTHVLVFDLAKRSDSTTHLPLVNQRRRISLLHKAYEGKGLLDAMENAIEGFEDVLSDASKEMIAKARCSVDKRFAQVRAAPVRSRFLLCVVSSRFIFKDKPTAMRIELKNAH